MTAPVAPPPSRFQADLVSCALILLTVTGVVMAFVLTQQHEPIPGYLDAMTVGGLTSLGFYKAASPQQQAQVAQVAQQVQQLGTAVDLNHLDTMQQLAAAPAAPATTVVQLDSDQMLVQREGATVVVPQGHPYMEQPVDLPPMAPSDRPAPAGDQLDELLEELHTAAAAAAPSAPSPSLNAPPVAS